MHESMEDGSGPILYCTGSLFLVLWAARMRFTCVGEGWRVESKRLQAECPDKAYGRGCLLRRCRFSQTPCTATAAHLGKCQPPTRVQSEAAQPQRTSPPMRPGSTVMEEPSPCTV